MKLLAIDTATEACSVALLWGEASIQRFEMAPRRHAELVLPWVGAVLAEAGATLGDLDALAVTRGPGSFTGVRIGLGVAQGLAAGAGLGLLGVSTLAALAWTGARLRTGAERVVTALDARMGEIYAAGFGFDADGGSPRVLMEERVCRPDRLKLEDAGWRAVGPGFAAYPELVDRLSDRLQGLPDASVFPSAEAVAHLAAAEMTAGQQPMPPERVEPVYLRDQVAKKPRA